LVFREFVLDSSQLSLGLQREGLHKMCREDEGVQEPKQEHWGGREMVGAVSGKTGAMSCNTNLSPKYTQSRNNVLEGVIDG